MKQITGFCYFSCRKKFIDISFAEFDYNVALMFAIKLNSLLKALNTDRILLYSFENTSTLSFRCGLVFEA